MISPLTADHPIDTQMIRAEVLAGFAKASGDLPVGTIQKLRQEWWHAFELIKDEVRDGDVIITLYTGGWSGNQDIIDALARSSFWQSWWLRSERGGVHTFKILASAWAMGTTYPKEA